MNTHKSCHRSRQRSALFGVLLLVVVGLLSACEKSDQAADGDDVDATRSAPAAFQLVTERTIQHFELPAMDVGVALSHSAVPERGFNGLYAYILVHAVEDLDAELAVRPVDGVEVFDSWSESIPPFSAEGTIEIGPMEAGETRALVVGLRIPAITQMQSDQILEVKPTYSLAADGEETGEEGSAAVAPASVAVRIERVADVEEARATRDVELMENVWGLRAARAIDTGMALRESGDIEAGVEEILTEAATFKGHVENNEYSPEFLVAFEERLDDAEALIGRAVPAAFSEHATDRPFRPIAAEHLDLGLALSHSYVPGRGFNGLYLYGVVHAREALEATLQVLPINDTEVFDVWVEGEDSTDEGGTLDVGSMASGETREFIVGLRLPEGDDAGAEEILAISYDYALPSQDESIRGETRVEMTRFGDIDEARETRDSALMQRVWEMRIERAVAAGMEMIEAGNAAAGEELVATEATTFKAHLENNEYPEEFLTEMIARLESPIQED